MQNNKLNASKQLKVADLDFQTMPAGATSVIHPGLLGVGVFIIIFS